MFKTKVIQIENKDDCYIQAVTASGMWTTEFGKDANQAAMIRAMCSIGCRSQAEDVSVPVWWSMSAHTNDCVVLDLSHISF